jgi:hypothetical protein
MKYLLTIFLFFSLLVNPMDILAANTGIGCGGGLGPIGEWLCGSPTNEAVGSKMNIVIGRLIDVMIVVAGLYFLIQVILAGYAYISAGGDTKKTQDAWRKIQNSVLGLLIVVIAWVLTGLIGSIVGLDILNPGQVIEDFWK